MAVKLPRNVKVLAAVSLLSDVASEMIYPLLPLFLATVLGVSTATLGAIEGLAESVSSLLRLPAGWLSDRFRSRKPLVVFGYALAAVARPLVGLAQGAGQVLAIRLTDRFGKGLRSAPRDALIADSVQSDQRGYAFGVHRAADHLGAVMGPLLAWALLTLGLVELRGLFLWAAAPGLLAVALLALVREPRGVAPAAPATPAAPAGPLGSPFWRYLGVLFLFTLSSSSDAFLLLRATDLGVPTAMVPLLWAMLHVVKSVSSVFGGSLSDRLGRPRVILGGWLIYAAVYLGFAFALAQWQVWALFLVYGLYFGATEGVEKALVADLVPAAKRGTAFGWFNATIGLAALPASVLFGLVWEWRGASAAFLMGAAVAGVATVAFGLAVARKREPR